MASKRKKEDKKQRTKQDRKTSSTKRQPVALALSPSVITFEGEYTHQREKQLKIKNLSDQKVMFKIESNRPDIYYGRPRVGIIEPRQTATVRVLLIHFPDNYYGEVFFLNILAMVLDGERVKPYRQYFEEAQRFGCIINSMKVNLRFGGCDTDTQEVLFVLHRAKSMRQKQWLKKWARPKEDIYSVFSIYDFIEMYPESILWAFVLLLLILIIRT